MQGATECNISKDGNRYWSWTETHRTTLHRSNQTNSGHWRWKCGIQSKIQRRSRFALKIYRCYYFNFEKFNISKWFQSLEPTIRWTRNNEPIKPSQRLESGYANGEAWLKFSDLRQEDVADYKCEAVNPAGKASTVANLVLKRNNFYRFGTHQGSVLSMKPPNWILIRKVVA